MGGKIRREPMLFKPFSARNLFERERGGEGGREKEKGKKSTPARARARERERKKSCCEPCSSDKRLSFLAQTLERSSASDTRKQPTRAAPARTRAHTQRVRLRVL
eukprot:6193880-Pleurochrysis_carterae.AAC.2